MNSCIRWFSQRVLQRRSGTRPREQMKINENVNGDFSNQIWLRWVESGIKEFFCFLLLLFFYLLDSGRSDYLFRASIPPKDKPSLICVILVLHRSCPFSYLSIQVKNIRFWKSVTDHPKKVIWDVCVICGSRLKKKKKSEKNNKPMTWKKYTSK